MVIRDMHTWENRNTVQTRDKNDRKFPYDYEMFDVDDGKRRSGAAVNLRKGESDGVWGDAPATVRL